MEETAFYLSIIQKYINSKQKILKPKNIFCAQEIFQEIFQPITWKKAELNGCAYDFSVDYRDFDTNNIINIHKYLMKKKNYKILFGLTKKMFIGLLTSIVNGSNHIKCVSLSNQKCMIQPTLINLYPNEYT